MKDKTALKITLTESNNPIIERYSDELKVGERELSFTQLYDTLLEMIPIDNLVSNLANTRIDDFESYLSYCMGTTYEGGRLILALLKSAHEVLQHIESEVFDEVFTTIAELIDDDSLSNSQYRTILANWGQSFDKVMADELTENIKVMERNLRLLFSSSDNKTENIQAFQNLYANLLAEYANENLSDWVENHIQFLPYGKLEKHLSERLKNKKTIFQTIVPPKNATLMTTSSAGTVFFYDLPANKYSVKYHDVRMEVGHPRLLFAIYTNNNGVTEVRLAALKGTKPLSETTELFRYPFSNVFKDGKVCWSDYHDLAIDTIPTFFLSAPNNSHLGNNTYELYQEFQNKDFNEDLLEPLGFTLEYWF